MRAVSVGVRGVVACHRQRTRALGNPLVGSLDHRLQLHIAHSRVRRSRTDSYDPGVQLATAAAFLGKRCQMRAPPTGRGLRDPRSRGREGRHATDAQHSQHIYITVCLRGRRAHDHRSEEAPPDAVPTRESKKNLTRKDVTKKSGRSVKTNVPSCTSRLGVGLWSFCARVGAATN